MITVKKINGKTIVINCELIQSIEGESDTIVHLTTSEKLIVADRPAEIVAKVIEYRKSINCPGFDIHVHPEQVAELEAIEE